MQSRKVKRVLLVLVLLIIVFLLFSYWYMMKCEGNWRGEPLEKKMKMELIEIKKGMESDIEYLQKLGPRNSENEKTYNQLRQCEEWIRQRWESQGYVVKKHTFSIREKEYSNLEIEIKGRTLPSEIIIISAQYDTLPDSPGANNNGSGIAILFQLSQLLRKRTPDRTLRLLNFVNEEDPFFGTEMMGSFQYAKRCRQQGEDIRVMLSLDALGVYKNEPGSQRLPFPFSIFYPDRGNFLAFIGNLQSRKYVKEVTKGFKKGSSFQIQAGVAPEWAKGGSWSDHSSFWKFGYPGIMVTDTGGFRSAHHTTKEDTIEKLDFEAMSRIVIGMYACAVHLTSLQK
ncbi:MAG: peptidase [Deltaproteobacteria bacterium]|nr:peptidase [Deltaproteobacteria bacterium]